VRKDIDGIAFDLDGTLYPNYRFYIRLVPFLLKEFRLLGALGKARGILREDSALKTSNGESESHDTEADNLAGVSFYKRQSCLMGAILKRDSGAIQEKTERLIYRGWEPLFKGLKLFPLVKETLHGFRNGGLKLGLLSDFPPEKKLEYLGISGLWDAVLCSETFGFLKPDPLPFLELTSRMKVRPERLLYVGNSVTYDIEGARNAGLQAALICSPWRKKYYRGDAAFVFSNYRQLYNYMLG
jgi:putative hydrolase of the HAD superfamily